MKKIINQIFKRGMVSCFIFQIKLYPAKSFARVLGGATLAYSIIEFCVDNISCISTNPSSVILGVISLIIMITPSIIENNSEKNKWRSNSIDFDKSILPYITLSRSQVNRGYVIRQCRSGYAVISDSENKFLLQNPVKLSIEKGRYCKVLKEIRRNIPDGSDILKKYYHYYRINNVSFFNEDKICLISDFFCEHSGIRCAKGDYFSGLLTNRMWLGKITRRDTNYEERPMKKRLWPIDENNVLRDLADTLLNNQIGASTLAITSDNYLIIVMQNGQVQVNPGKMSCSSSGSADWKDYHIGDTLQQTVTRTMERELCEELGISSSEIRHTQVIGYFRWLDLAGQPQFLGVTKLNCPNSRINVNIKEISERWRVERVSTQNELLNIIDQLICKDNISVQLEINLRALKQYLSSQSSDWLFSN